VTIREVSDRYGLSQDTLRYYERAGMIPPVTRTAGGVRDYKQEDLKWVELAKCMRSAGLPVEVLARYVRLFRQGDETIPERLELLKRQRDELVQQQTRIADTLARLEYKIARYEEAERTGVLKWKHD